MMPYHNISIKYGPKTIDKFLPSGRGTVKVIDSLKIQSEVRNIKKDLVTAIENPLNSLPLKELVEQHYPGSGKKVLVMADDNTRPNKHTKILHPIILDYLVIIRVSFVAKLK